MAAENAAPEPYEPIRQNYYDVRPLLQALQKIADAGRARKESGIDDEAVKYARLAFKALDYYKADERKDIDTAARLVGEIWGAKL